MFRLVSVPVVCAGAFGGSLVRYLQRVALGSAPEPAVLTKVITFAPRYILRNRLRVGVAYRQHGASEQARLLAPDEEVAFNWRSHRAEQLLELALSEEVAAAGSPAVREA